ncbi:MAG TPA: hypothetical protein VKE49_04695, partial [Myxococcaceae bacterium]|nr:hypothetical protein [Myxococcaceae bacterium]
MLLGVPSNSKIFFLRESLARTNIIAQKIFSSIAHIEQSSKKFLAKNNGVASNSRSSRACSWVCTAVNSRVAARGERTNSSRSASSAMPALVDQRHAIDQHSVRRIFAMRCVRHCASILLIDVVAPSQLFG